MTDDQTPKVLHTVTKLASLINRHPATIRRMIKKDKLKGFKVGKAWVVADKEYKRFIEEWEKANE